MLFNSYTFVVFFAVVLSLYYLFDLSWKAKKAVLLVASYVFYAAWNPPFVALIWISTFVDWHAARWMAAAESPKARRALLLLSLTTNLGMLGYFKYGGLVLQSFVDLMATLGLAYSPPTWSIVLPVGISFYTFQTLSYTIDVYRGKLQPARSPIDFALYVAFFPQLVAGPIVRASEFLPQLDEPKRATAHQFGWGITLLVIGIFAKVVLADSWMAPIADYVYANTYFAGFIDAWVGQMALASQVFFDFSGYSSCAIGAALCMGFTIPDNFRFPYAAIGFADFWRRWHISLSTWLRDYLYIPLGGSRGTVVRTYVNLMITMLLGGLWHGAAWRLLLWGGAQGVLLAGERLLADLGARLPGPKVLGAMLTFFLFSWTWPLFRNQSVADAWIMYQAMGGLRPDDLALNLWRVLLVAITTGTLLAAHWYLRDDSLEGFWGRFPPALRAIVISLMLVAITLSPGEDRAFVYFQF